MLPMTDTHVIDVSGELDLYSAPALKRRITDAIDDGKRQIVVDLTEATFVDSTTLGVLVGALRRLKPEGGSLSVVCPDNDVRRLFDMTGVDRIFEIYETRDEAIRAFEG